MVGALMLAIYPWAGIPTSDQLISNIGFFQTDEPEFFYPITVATTKALRAGVFPQWDPFTFAGAPDIHGSVEPTHPLRFILYFLATPIQQLQIWLLINLILATLGMYRLLSAHQIGRAGALFGGITWGLSGSMSFYAIFGNVPAALALVPWIILLVKRSFETRSLTTAATCGLVWGVMFHTGHLLPVYEWSWLLGGYSLFALGRSIWSVRSSPCNPHPPIQSACAVAITIGVVLLLVSAPIWLKIVVWYPYFAREPEPLKMQLLEAFPAGGLLEALAFPANPFWSFSGNLQLRLQAYVGVLPLVMTPFGLCTKRPLAFVAIGAVALSASLVLGFVPVVVAARHILPMFGTVHLSSLSDIGALGFSILGALGFDWCQRRMAWREGTLRLRIMIGATVAVLCFHATELMLFFYKENPTQPATSAYLFPPTPILQAMERLQGPFHVMPVKATSTPQVWRRPMLTGRTPDIFGVRAVSGYEDILPRYIFRLWNSVATGEIANSDRKSAAVYINYSDSGLNLDLLRRLSVGFLLAAPDAHPHDGQGNDLVASGSLIPRYVGRDGSIFAIPGALPRVFVVAKARAVDDDTAFQALMKGTFNPSVQVLISGFPDASAQWPDTEQAKAGVSPGAATIVRETLNSMTVAVTSSAPAFLQVNDSWAPGWHAMIDGNPTELYRSNYAFRALAIPTGRHIVTLRYSPWTFGVGLTAEVLGIIVVICLILVRRFARIGSWLQARHG